MRVLQKPIWNGESQLSSIYLGKQRRKFPKNAPHSLIAKPLLPDSIWAWCKSDNDKKIHWKWLLKKFTRLRVLNASILPSLVPLLASWQQTLCISSWLDTRDRNLLPQFACTCQSCMCHLVLPLTASSSQLSKQVRNPWGPHTGTINTQIRNWIKKLKGRKYDGKRKKYIENVYTDYWLSNTTKTLRIIVTV